MQQRPGFTTANEASVKHMDVPPWIPVACMAIGTVTVLRAAFIVATKSTGRFRGDPLLTLIAGFLMIYLGPYLLAR